MYLPPTARRFLLIGVIFCAFMSAASHAVVRTGAGGNSMADDVMLIENSTALVDVVRTVPYQANGVVYRTQDQRLYFTQSGTVGAEGNSISSLDPISGEMLSSVFIGSEPNKIAISDDGASMYVGLDGSFSIRRFDPESGPGIEFPVGYDFNYGQLIAGDLAVSPGNPNRVAVARISQSQGAFASVAINDNGTQLPNTAIGHFLAFASPSRLYSGINGSEGMRTMNVNDLGVTETGAPTSFNVGRLKFDNGIIYTASGQVINPTGPSLVGTFSVPGATAFVPDSSVGRVYYATREGSSIVIRAFDMATFILIGTLTIPNATSEPATMIRYGSNGLALRTSDRRLYLIQTSLIPTGEPLPTPTSTASPTPTPAPPVYTAHVREMNLTQVNDLVSHTMSGRLLVSVPSIAGAVGNTIATIDPVTATVENRIWIGSEPNKIAMTSDQQALFVGIDGAGSVRKLNLATNTPEYQFSLGASAGGLAQALDIDVLPGSTNIVAVLANFGNGLGNALYDSGTRRGQPVGQQTSMGFLNADQLLNSSGRDLIRYSVGPTGLSGAGVINATTGGDFIVENGLVFGRNASVIDGAENRLRGTFAGASFATALTVDAAQNRIYFLTNDSPRSIRAYRLDTFTLAGTIPLPSNVFVGSTSSLVRWGASGLAFRGEQGRIYLLQSSLIDPTYVPPAPTPTITPTPTQSPIIPPTFVRQVLLPVNDIAISPANQGLYASIASSAGVGVGNTISKIDPASGQLLSSAFIGSEPSRIAMSSDGGTLYAKLDGAGDAVRRFDIVSNTAGQQFTGPVTQQDMRVMPGAPETVGFASGGSFGVSIWDNGVRRPNNSSGGVNGISSIDFANANTIYGYNGQSSGFDLVRFAVDPSGVVPTPIGRNWISGFGVQIRHESGKLYSTFGAVFDTALSSLAGSFRTGFVGNVMAIDPAQNKVFFFGNSTLQAFDMTTYLPLGSVAINNVQGNPTRLVRWGTNGLALRTADSGFPSERRLYLIQSSLVSSEGAVPTSVNFSSSTYSGSESASAIQVTVTRGGDLSGAASVSYATGDGTAIAGEDYIAVSGNVTFEAGEATKTISISTINDNIFEGNETFTITLTGATGGNIFILPPSMGTVSIIDNESAPGISGSATSVNETGTNFVVNVPVNLNRPAAPVVTVNFTTVNGTATAGTDYVATSGTLTFNALETSKTIPVTIIGDSLVEGNETFTINLNGATIGFVSNPTIPINIVDLGGFEADATVRPAGDGFTTAADLVQIRRFVAGLDTPSTSPNEFQRSDCAPRSALGDGVMNAADITQARRYVSGLDPLTNAGGPTMAIDPGLRASIGGSLFGEKFGVDSLLRLVNGKDGAVVVELVSGSEVAAVSFRLQYDAALGKPVVSLGDLPDGAVLTVNDRVAGELTVLIDSAGPLGAGGKALRL
ncbi:MAG: Calx-beta domain-containing protein, partial [Pyrinomonadaceae bacterium]